MGITGGKTQAWWHPPAPRALVNPNEAPCPWDVCGGVPQRFSTAAGGDGNRDPIKAKERGHCETLKARDWGNWGVLGGP